MPNVKYLIGIPSLFLIPFLTKPRIKIYNSTYLLKIEAFL